MTDPTVDIIIPVHNAPHLTEMCLNSVARTRDPVKHRIILIDDGSDTETQGILERFIEEHQNTVLSRNLEAQGFTKAANKGLRESSRQMAIILNSDTEVPTNWIQKLARTLFGTNGVGIVGPLSNAASYQSIPRVEPNPKERIHRQTVINELPPGMTMADVNGLLESIDWGHPIRVPLVHGFCFAMRREVMADIGYFDEMTFPRGYGEENDYCFRATDAGWGLAIAPDIYVWHKKTGSYDESERFKLVAAAKKALHQKHGEKRLENSLAAMKNTAARISASTVHLWTGERGNLS